MKSILYLLAGLSLLTINATAAPSGAIFTTLPDGSRVNANIYTNKYDVYLDGGPGPNAPSTAAGLPEGDYYFQVTDPSGKVLLSEDPVNCRSFHVNAAGVIDAQNGTHAIGIDIDHPERGAITVQLMPYSDTPNPGGVYKVWITPIDQFVGDTTQVDNDTGFHGFIPAWCKTDNFKVLTGDVPPPPNEYLGVLYVDKFFDINNNGIWEKETEPHIGEWPFSIVDNLGVTNNYYTPTDEAFRTDFQYGDPTYRIVTEDMVDGWFQTALSVDDTAIQPPSQTVTVDYPVPDDLLTPVTHVVVFGNAICGEVIGQKFYDQDADGVLDDGEPPVEGVLFTLTGVDILANNVSLTGYTGADGFVRFENLIPGTYTLTETPPSDPWFPTTPVSSGSFTVSGGETVTHVFGNCIYGEVVGQKFYDRDADGVLDDGEPPVEGILFTLTGVDNLGNTVNRTGYTGADGFVRFEDLVPGTYTLTETVPGGTWFATTPVSSGSFVLNTDTTVQHVFGNACRGGAAFGTKGYWHNKNGLKESTLADFAFLNSLLPWMAPSTYFGNGDEPIDGKFANGKPVPAATENKVILALAGTAFAEQSNFLVDANANGDPREQLAQQLDAFIMNTRHRLEGDVVILLPNGTWVPASGIIANAVSIWATGSAAAQTAMKTLLDNYNNSGAVPFVHAEPCPVAYPVVAPVAP